MSGLLQYDPLKDKSYRNTALGPAVADFLAWKELGGARPSTIDTYERSLSRGCLMFPQTSLSEFSDSQMLHLAKSFSPGSRRTRVVAWQSFFKWAIKTRQITLNPCDPLPAFRMPAQKVYDLFSQAEITALCGLPVRDGALMTLMFGTGARKGDCSVLQYKHWRADATPEAPYGVLVFLDGKGGKDRQIPATEPVARALSELAILDGLKDDDYLWYKRPGGRSAITRTTPMLHAGFDRWWNKCLAEAGVRYRNPHLTRHTFATSFLRGRGRLETLQLMLGHGSIKITADMYGHLDMRDVAVDLGLVEIVSE